MLYRREREVWRQCNDDDDDDGKRIIYGLETLQKLPCLEGRARTDGALSIGHKVQLNCIIFPLRLMSELTDPIPPPSPPHNRRQSTTQ